MQFNPRLNRRNEDPDTSHQAADRLHPEALWRLILQYLASHPRPQGWTESELADALGVHDGLWKRLSDVRREALATWAIDENGQKVTRPGPSNRNQGASVITSKGYEYLGQSVKVG